MAHALLGYNGPCSNIHGHTYHLCVTVLGQVLIEPGHRADGMVLDFTDLKGMVQQKVISKYDHALVLNERSPHLVLESLQAEFGKVLQMKCQPTCENILLEIVEVLRETLPPPLQLIRVRLRETGTSFAEWHLQDQPALSPA